MRIFIDGLNLLRVESKEHIYQIELDQNQTNWLKSDGFNQFFSTTHPISLHQNDVITINHQTYPLEIGVVGITKEFEKKFRYSGQLGYDYHQTHTSFALFSPVAKEVFIVINYKEYPMTYSEPVWKATVQGDLEGLTYWYKIRLVNEFKNVNDPYAIASDHLHNVIIDWNKTLPMIDSPIKVKNPVDTVIYEGHVRDMSIHLDVESKGLFEGLIEHSKKLNGTVLQYIKRLGMTHLQLLPVFDFEDVDDIDKTKQYNWGYNPSQYFCVEGWFSKNPQDPYDRINGLKKVVNHAHQIKLGINMDVVYNHVFDHLTFPYDDIVPGYFYRHTNHYHMTHACYLDNDVETRNYMVRKLIIDSLKHFAIHYKIDGFRFDLMGLLDIETMLEINHELKQINPNIMLYGEGWNMISEVPAKSRSNMNNQNQFSMIGHFNDFYRNTMKGELHGPGLGYAMGNQHLAQKAMEAIIGSPHMFTSPNQSLNYVECHDNMTYYDKMLLSCGYENPEFKVCQDFANHLIAISQGVPFYHAGQEFYRSKKGIENSYNSPDEINQIHWHIKESGVKKLKQLLKLRKKHPLYRQTTYNSQISISKERHLIVYRLENDKELLIHYIKNTFEIEKLPLDQGKLVFPSQKALTNEKYIYVDKPGIYIIHFQK
ncbi:MAG: type I pullulanase [Acholeplasmataceae bacterium]|nr:type I pullulanase [Acholeplasmataceae bacterium]